MDKKPGILHLLKPYLGTVTLLIVFTIFSNGINLLIPKLISKSIDAFSIGNFTFKPIIIQFSIAVIGIFIFSYLQSIIQTYASEKVARDLRTKLADKISKQSYAFIEQANPSKLLTNLTADVDSIKLFYFAGNSLYCLFFIYHHRGKYFNDNYQLETCALRDSHHTYNWYYFFVVLKKVRALFIQARAVIDWLNKVINESILGAAIIRVVNSQQPEYNKFLEANTKAKDFGLKILYLFAGLIPVITFTSNMAALSILALGGHFVITGSMSLGNFAAFNSYVSMLIFPILIIGFMSNVIAQATASYARISNIIETPDPEKTGAITEKLTGEIELQNVNMLYGQAPVLKDISFNVSPGSKVAVIGPTAAGKTQLLYLLTGLMMPTSGTIKFDGRSIEEYNSESFHRQVGYVFQDSIIFNMSVRENIAFSDIVTDQSLEKAIETAELKDFIDSLPDKLSTIVSERGSSLSGGQKQRIMLARALALDPKILLLDDFTARVDNNTEKKILENIQRNYPGLTLLSVTQKMASVEAYDQIILLMQGELIAIGKHEELMQTSPEYVQLLNSQKSTSNYELQS